MTPAMANAQGRPGTAGPWSSQLDLEQVAASLRPAAWLAFAFVYFSAATNLLAEFSGEPNAFRVLTSIDLLSHAAARTLPLFLAAVALSALPVPNAVRVWGRRVIFACLASCAIAAAIDFLAHLYFGQRLSTGVIFVFAETNLAESRAFLSTYANAEASLLALFLAFPFVTVAVSSRLPGRTAGRVAFSVIFALAAANGLYASTAAGYDPAAALVRGVAAFREELAAYRKLEGQLDAGLGGVVSEAGVEKRTVVLVLGESTNRNHFGLYGYPNGTTPRLSALGDELMVFRDVVSPHSHTIPTLKKLFSFANHETAEPWHEQPMLLDVLRAGGYKTFWISNQEAYGTFGDVSSAIASRADVQIFHNRGSTQEQADGFDGELIGYLDRVLELDAAPRKFVVLHLMGTHTSYRSRYPAPFEHFSAADIDPDGRDYLDEARLRTIAQYDNAIRYGDTVVADMIARVAMQRGDAAVLFLSDHGEEVYDARDFRGHTEKIGNRHMIEIPFTLWLSDAYRAARPQRAATLAGHVAAPYMSDDLIHTVVELCDVSLPRHEPSRSLANAAFDPARPRIYAGRDYDRDVRHSDAPRLIGRNFEKIWAHRVNSVGKLDQLGRLYAGVELDLMIQIDSRGAMHFDINHPPADSIGLSLDAYWSRAQGTGPLGYWLDIKNLDADNAAAAASQLRALMQRHGLATHQVVTESTEYIALAELSAAGLRTSFYLPYLKLEELDDEELERRAVDLARQAREARAGAISFPGHMLDYVRTSIRPRVGDVEMLTWYPRRSLANPEDAPFLQTVIDDPAVEIVLVGHRTRHDR